MVIRSAAGIQKFDSPIVLDKKIEADIEFLQGNWDIFPVSINMPGCHHLQQAENMELSLVPQEGSSFPLQTKCWHQ